MFQPPSYLIMSIALWSGADFSQASLWTVMLVVQQFLVHVKLGPWWFLGCFWTSWPISSYLRGDRFGSFWIKVVTHVNKLYLRTIVWTDDIGIWNCLEMATRDLPNLCKSGFPHSFEQWCQTIPLYAGKKKTVAHNHDQQWEVNRPWSCRVKRHRRSFSTTC